MGSYCVFWIFKLIFLFDFGSVMLFIIVCFVILKVIFNDSCLMLFKGGNRVFILFIVRGDLVVSVLFVVINILFVIFLVL